MTGRGWGKTRTGAEDIIRFAALNPNTLSAVVAPTWGELNRICFHGESGLVQNLPKECLMKGSKGFNESRLELTLWNGSRIHGYSAEAYKTLRGPNFHRAWLDEIASWQYLEEAWNQIMFSLRAKVGNESPKCVVTSTPQPSPLIKSIAFDEETHLTRGSTYDNVANIDPAAVARMARLYEHTGFGRQELYGEILDETEGALWQRPHN